MIHELREYRIDVRAADAYFSLFRDLAMPIRGSAYGRLVANWLIPGEVVTFYHLWEYDSLGERTAKRAALAQVERWTHDFLPAAAALVAIGDNDPKWEEEYQKLGTTAGAYDDWHEGRRPA